MTHFVATDSLSHQPSKVDFVPKKAQPQPTAPPDLSEEEFLSEDDVQSTPIPRSQLGQVIISYENTISKTLFLRKELLKTCLTYYIKFCKFFLTFKLKKNTSVYDQSVCFTCIVYKMNMHLCLPPYAVKIYMMWIKIQHGTVLFIFTLLK